MQAKPKLGRPPKLPADKQSEIMQVKVTPAERKHLESVAGESFSAWARGVLLRAAKRAG